MFFYVLQIVYKGQRGFRVYRAALCTTSWYKCKETNLFVLMQRLYMYKAS